MPLRRSLLALALLVAMPAAVVAQEVAPGWYDEDYQTCTDRTTLEIVECTMALTREWDERLNAAYGEVMDGLPSDRAEALRAVQRAWIAWRDANCRWYAGGEGSISRIEAAECQHVLTRTRAQELEMMTGR